MPVIIHGPAGCGKTTFKEALRRKYKCARVIDEWDDGAQRLGPRDLALTTQPPPYKQPGIVVSFEQAAAQLGIKSLA